MSPGQARGRDGKQRGLLEDLTNRKVKVKMMVMAIVTVTVRVMVTVTVTVIEEDVMLVDFRTHTHNAFFM